MKRHCLLTAISLLFFISSFSQAFRVHGKITNNKLEPLAFASVRVKETEMGAVTKEDGTYELRLEEGKYDIGISMIGFKPRIITIVVKNADQVQNCILEADTAKSMTEIVLKSRLKDRSEEIIRRVIRNKEAIQSAAGNYSCNIYIKAVAQDSSVGKKNAKAMKAAKKTTALDRMDMAEIFMRMDHGAGQQIKEERVGVKKRGNTDGLFYLSSTEGDFDFYNNLVNVPALSPTSFLSPVSYSGLLAYHFKMIGTGKEGNQKTYTIAVRPRQVSNATVEGEITIADSSWVILHTDFRFPSYHLPFYDFFEVEQDYKYVNQQAWMISRQAFTYYSKSGKASKSGQTIVSFDSFALNKTFPPKYFGNEISVTAAEAYKKDSSFWQHTRTVPLTDKEVSFIRYNDSIYNARHTLAYLDSMDRIMNTITWKTVLITGQNFSNHVKERHWNVPPITSIYDPFYFGGSRLKLAAGYNRVFPSKKNIDVLAEVSYGLHNHDVNGGVHVSRMYNPFSRGFYTLRAERDFEYIFQGDAWINMLKRSNVYLNNTVGVGHGLELLNGLFLYTDLDFALRRSVSGYKTNSEVDSLFGNILTDNRAVAFAPYNALYGKIRLQYTPGQKFIREPAEKIILGSKWPTFYATYRKGIPNVFQSQVNFDYLEFGIEQQAKIGLLGTSTYSIRSGSFLSQKDLRLIDYKFERRGDPILFNNPAEAFQSLDSSFPLFKRFYEAHWVHEFNGFFINKVPFLKRLQLREVAGGGFLIAPERNLHYVEAFVGVERVFKWPFSPLAKFKVGLYVVGSASNQYKPPVEFKIGFSSWDRKRNKWL